MKTRNDNKQDQKNLSISEGIELTTLYSQSSIPSILDSVHNRHNDDILKSTTVPGDLSDYPSLDKPENDTGGEIETGTNLEIEPGGAKETGLKTEGNREYLYQELEEIEEPETILISQSNTISQIDSIEYHDSLDTMPDITSSIDIAEKGSRKKYKRKKKEKKKQENHMPDMHSSISFEMDEDGLDQNDLEGKAPELLDDLDEIESLDEVESLDIAEEAEFIEPDIIEEIPLDQVGKIHDRINNEIVDSLIQKIDSDGDSVEYPGRINLDIIDDTLKNEKLDYQTSKKSTKTSDEMFGVNKAEIFYTIDKEIYGSHANKTNMIRKKRSQKSGIVLPALVLVISLSILLVAAPIFFFYFKATESASLEENVINDVTIWKKIKEMKDRENLLAQQRLEEDRKKLEFQQKNIEAMLQEEREKAEAAIEQEYSRKLQSLENRNVSKAEMARLEEELRQEKNRALIVAQTENARRIKEQKDLLKQKESQIEQEKQRLKEEAESFETELSRRSEEFEEQLKAEEQSRKFAQSQLQELRERSNEVESFNSTVFQLINNAMGEFERGNRDTSLRNLEGVIKYYRSNRAIVDNNEQLKEKMETDLFFVDTISSLIEESRQVSTFNQEYASIVNRLNKATDYYRQAETLYNRRNYEQAATQYALVLKQFDSINKAHEKSFIVEEKIQDILAASNYQKAVSSMKLNQYETALVHLSSVIKESPRSSYVDQALKDILDITSTLSLETASTDDNKQAARLYERAQSQTKNQRYDDALDTYYKIIVDYPSSTYVASALNQSLALKDLMNQQGISKLDDQMRDRFSRDYERFIKARESGNLERAREYYFSALKSAFNVYADNSIADFQDLEDEYIAMLLSENKSTSESDLSSQMAAIENRLKKQHQAEMEALRNELTEDYDKALSNAENQLNAEKKIAESLREDKNTLETELASLQNDYEKMKLKADAASSADIQKIEQQFKKDLESKSSELARVQEELDRKNSNLKQLTSDRDAIEKERDELKATLDKTDISALKAEYEKKIREAEENFKQERYYSDKLRQQLATLQDDYKILEREKDTAREYEKKYRAAMQEEIEKEKERLRKEYEDQLADIRNSFSIDESVLNAEEKRIIESLTTSTTIDGGSDALSNTDGEESFERTIVWEDKLFARIIELIDDTVTFQFLSLNLIPAVREGDTVKIIRFSGNGSSREEVIIGYLTITYINPKSLYGRGRIDRYNGSNSIQTNDLLKN
jgi:hypothetical protein